MMKMDNDTGKRFLNYEDPDWSKDDFEWLKMKMAHKFL